MASPGTTSNTVRIGSLPMLSNQHARHAKVCGPWQTLWPRGSFGGSGEQPADQIQVEIRRGLSYRLANKLRGDRPRPGFAAKSPQSAKNSPSCRLEPATSTCCRSSDHARPPAWSQAGCCTTRRSHKREFVNRSKIYFSLNAISTVG